VPSKTLPPLSSMDRMANGEHLGQCPTCGGHRWWDNRSRKATGEMSRSQPDYACTSCRHGRWNDGRQRAGRPTTRRTLSARVTVVPTVRPPSGVGQRAMTCAALKRDGTPCRNGAMAGSPFCGPHSTVGDGAATPASNQCRGTTKAPAIADAGRGCGGRNWMSPDRRPAGVGCRRCRCDRYRVLACPTGHVSCTVAEYSRRQKGGRS
jgi:hypothetical protein